MPKNRVVPESDGPFAQVKGNVVMPWCFLETVQYLSNIWEIHENEVSKILENNSIELLSIINKSKVQKSLTA